MLIIGHFPFSKTNWLVLLANFLPLILVTAQNTVGLTYINQEKTIGGYNLIYPENQSTAFLLNECGEIAHQWEDTDDARPGKTAYLLENGNLLKSKSDDSLLGQSFGFGGGLGGIIEMRSWDNDLLWSYILADSLNRQHHDIHFMENGNVLMIVWEPKFLDEIVANGFDTISNSQTDLWPEYLLEINPATNERVWEWHSWDHLIQDYDSTKLNYGVVSEHPELININYQDFAFLRPDFMHANAIDYDPVKDQVILSVRNFHEIWIIDHSTTTEEAAGHTGGNSGKGGDLLFRWGNPAAYQMGTVDDQQLFFQHDAQWIDDFIDPQYEHYGEVVLFNNMVGPDFSYGQMLKPVWDESTQSYLTEAGRFLPEGFSKTFTHPFKEKGYSPLASSVQVMGEGSIIMCASRQGRLFELTPSGGLAWEYVTPLRLGFPIPQGFQLGVGENFTFHCKRYPENYPAFFGKDLSSKGYIEQDPNTAFCLFTEVVESAENAPVQVFPNPARDRFFIEGIGLLGEHTTVFDQYGRVAYFTENQGERIEIVVVGWPRGIYLVQVGSRWAGKVLVVD